MPRQSCYLIIIVGAGFAGVGMAVALLQAGIALSRAGWFVAAVTGSGPPEAERAADAPHS